MTKYNGGVIGATNGTTQISASGIWNMETVSKKVKNNSWPKNVTGEISSAVNNFNSTGFLIAEEATPNGVFVDPSGTRMYVTGSTSDAVYQYSMSTPWDLKTAVYTNLSFSFASQDAVPVSVFFKPDGTKMYMVADGGDRIYQYSLSSAWNVNTASYDSVFLAFPDLVPRAMYIRDDGVKLYMVGTSNDRVYQYTMGTPWVINTATSDSINFLVSGQETTPSGLWFKPDGTVMYVSGSTSDRMWQYSLGTAWAVNTATSTGNSVWLGDGDTDPRNIQIRDDGTTFFMVGNGNDRVYKGTFGTPWDVSTAKLISNQLTITQETAIQSVFFNTSGDKMFVVGSATDTVYAYNLSVPWQLESAVYASESVSVNAQTGVPHSLFFKPDGTRMWVLGQDNDIIYQYSLSSAWNVSTATYDSVSLNVTSQDTDPRGMYFKPDGLVLYVAGITNDRIYQYNLSVAWDLSTATYATLFYQFSNDPVAVWFNSTGTRMYLTSPAQDLVYQVNLNTGWLLSSATSNTAASSIGTVFANPRALFFTPDLTKFFIAEGAVIRRYEIPSPLV
jgi:sugar lactone lactonase YvrE